MQTYQSDGEKEAGSADREARRLRIGVHPEGEPADDHQQDRGKVQNPHVHRDASFKIQTDFQAGISAFKWITVIMPHALKYPHQRMFLASGNRVLPLLPGRDRSSICEFALKCYSESDSSSAIRIARFLEHDHLNAIQKISSIIKVDIYPYN